MHELLVINLQQNDKGSVDLEFSGSTYTLDRRTVPLLSASIMRKSPSENGVLVSSMNSKNSS